MKLKRSKSARLTGSLNSQLAAYSATAAGLMLVAPAAHGSVRSLTSPTLTLTPASDGVTHTLSLSLGAFHGSLEGEHGAFTTTTNFYHGGGVMFVRGHLVQDTADQLVNLAPGAALQGNVFRVSPFAGRAAVQTTHIFTGTRTTYKAGHFLPAANQNFTGYIGFKTHQNAHTYYGWLRVQVHADSQDRPDQISILTDGNGVVGAFGLLGDNITVGEVGPAPEPGTLAVAGLGLLALGARGVRELRRRREAAAKN